MVLSPQDNARYFLDGNWPLWYILLRHSANTVTYGIFYIFILAYFTVVFSNHFLGYSGVRVVLRCQYVHRTRTSPDLELKYMKYSGEHNKRHCPDHRQTLAANSYVWCVFSSHLFRTSNSLEVPAGVTQDFSSTFHLRCVPLFFSREAFSRSFPSSSVKSN